MANKFQKSVLERLEQEASRKKQQETPAPAPARKESPQDKAVKAEEPIQPPPSQGTHAPAKNKAIKESKPAPKRIPPEKKTDTSGAAQPLPLEQFLHREPQRNARNKTFYLDGEVADAVHRAAVQQKVTDSKLVNDILKGVLASYLVGKE